jgi:hypothetical protein
VPSTTTRDADAIRAVHAFLRFQIADHKTRHDGNNEGTIVRYWVVRPFRIARYQDLARLGRIDRVKDGIKVYYERGIT